MTELDDEVRFHLQMRIDQLMRAGHSREDAERIAGDRLGDVEDLRRYAASLDARIESRRLWRRWVVDLVGDLRHGLRQMRRSPGTSVVAVLTMALGIGATTATAAAVHRLLVQPVPGMDPDRIVRVSRSNPAGTFRLTPTLPLFEAWRGGQVFEAVGYYTERDAVVQVHGRDETIAAAVLGPGLLEVFAVQPRFGRTFVDDDADVVLVSEWLARRLFGRGADAVGRQITVDRRAHTIIGVLPERLVIPFARASRLHVWTRPPADPQRVYPMVVARLRSGISDDAVTQQLNAAMAGVPGIDGEWKAHLSRPKDELSRTTHDSLLVLFAAVAVVLLAGCVNVANLLLARAEARQREFLVRRALGAGQGRLIRQLLAESSLLAACGWLGGVLLAHAGLSLAQAYRPPTLEALGRVTIDPALLVISLGVSGLAAVLFSLAPALLAGGRRVADQLRRQSLSAGADRRAARWRAGLVVAEVAMSALLLVGGGLLVRTLIEMRQAPLGFDPQGLYTVNLELPEGRYADKTARRMVLDELIERLQARPGMRRAELSLGGPAEPGATFGGLEVDGQAVARGEGRDVLGFNIVSPGFFQLSGIPLLEGRVFDDQSPAEATIVSAALARRLRPEGSAIGTRFRISPTADWNEVIGVVGDVVVPRAGGARGMTEVIYEPFVPHYPEAALVVRTTGEAGGLHAALQEVIGGVDPTIAVASVRSAALRAGEAQALPRFIAGILVMFSVVAVLMSATGLYGVIAYTVTRRWREIGIRMALGARPGHVLRSLLGAGLVMVTAGLAVGLSAAYLLTRFLRTVLFGVAPLDPLSFGSACVLVAAIAGAAVFVPARRATEIDPIAALRES